MLLTTAVEGILAGVPVRIERGPRSRTVQFATSPIGRRKWSPLAQALMDVRDQTAANDAARRLLETITGKDWKKSATVSELHDLGNVIMSIGDAS